MSDNSAAMIARMENIEVLLKSLLQKIDNMHTSQAQNLSTLIVAASQSQLDQLKLYVSDIAVSAKSPSAPKVTKKAPAKTITESPPAEEEKQPVSVVTDKSVKIHPNFGSSMTKSAWEKDTPYMTGVYKCKYGHLEEILPAEALAHAVNNEKYLEAKKNNKSSHVCAQAFVSAINDLRKSNKALFDKTIKIVGDDRIKENEIRLKEEYIHVSPEAITTEETEAGTA